jgi:hypothetical protein
MKKFSRGNEFLYMRDVSCKLNAGNGDYRARDFRDAFENTFVRIAALARAPLASKQAKSSARHS